ncbi:PEP-CTERM sorting domain-containing protein [Massilia eburnea]|uniref:PEP-CTERM sorting domain-containing protein n=1 Tax=Massilia eburnea TaxID=1776165 RepID=UPI001E2D3226|nr:PEP-CTERM sorting domain-containing protein [Massilia eburnea]
MESIAKKFALAASSMLLAASAFGATTIGNTTADDVMLAAQAADTFVFTPAWNPQAGPNGDTSGFGTAFDGYGSSGAWTLLGKNEGGSSTGFGLLSGLNFTFDVGTGTSGTWTVTSSASQNVALDLVLALKAGNGAGAFLLNNLSINPGQTLSGTWHIDWFTGNNQANPDISNVTVFGRDFDGISTPVPEPGEYAMLLAGLGLIGFVARRRKAL